MAIERVERKLRAWLSSELPWPLHKLAPANALIVAAAVVIGLAISMLPVGSGTTPRAMVALGLAACTVILWATQALPQAITSAVFMAMVLLTGTAPLKTVSFGFTSSAAWLVFGGLLTAAATEKTGFGRWVARKFFGHFHGSYERLILGILIGCAALSFLVPSNMGRVAITVPIIIALARDAGYAPGSQGYIGLIVAAVLGNFATAIAILPANLLSVMIAGTGEAMYGIHISYVRWLVLCAPVLGLAKTAMVYWMIPRLYKAPPPEMAPGLASASGSLSSEGMRVALIQACAIALWATDFAHGIRPGWIAIAAGLACYMPGIGVLPLTELLERKRLLMVIWIAGVLSLSTVISETGAGALLSSVLGQVMNVEGKSATYGYFTLAYLMSLITLITTMGGAVPTLMALVGGLATATGLPPETGMVALAAGSTALVLPYVAAPMVVGLALGNVNQNEAAKFTIWSAVLSWVTVIPLNALWWKLIGALP